MHIQQEVDMEDFSEREGGGVSPEVRNIPSQAVLPGVGAQEKARAESSPSE